MNNTRNYIPSLVIIIVGASIAWWSSHTASSMSKHIQNEVSKLVPQYHANPSVIRPLLVDPTLEPMLASSLSYIYEETKSDHEYRVVVTRGDSEEFGDGTNNNDDERWDVVPFVIHGFSFDSLRNLFARYNNRSALSFLGCSSNSQYTFDSRSGAITSANKSTTGNSQTGVLAQRVVMMGSWPSFSRRRSYSP